MPGGRGKAYSYVFDIVVVFAVVVLLCNFGNYFQVVFPVQGISMRPTIVDGDLAIVQPVNVSTLHVGDIVVYRDGLIDVIHRVIRIQGNGTGTVLTVKGDNNPMPDPVPVTQQILVGKVDAVVLYLGTFVTQPFNYLLAFVLICLLVVDYLEADRKGGAPVSPPPDSQA
ncbi:MAG TPA: signal peptidase I [Conexivisphaerales archaeon]|nr:signal peptidase I [Conexivisphaerales archaeon]